KFANGAVSAAFAEAYNNHSTNQKMSLRKAMSTASSDDANIMYADAKEAVDMFGKYLDALPEDTLNAMGNRASLGPDSGATYKNLIMRELRSELVGSYGQFVSSAITSTASYVADVGMAAARAPNVPVGSAMRGGSHYNNYEVEITAKLGRSEINVNASF
ncbi:MAG: hypothetical protein RPT11_06935, partial [Bermanella sp.]